MFVRATCNANTKKESGSRNRNGISAKMEYFRDALLDAANAECVGEMIKFKSLFAVRR